MSSGFVVRSENLRDLNLRAPNEITPN
jgi:hypothetical protein